MRKQLRQQIVHALWQKYMATSTQMQIINRALSQQGITRILLDHFAVIDLPGPFTGIPHLARLFTALGYEFKGKDYLPDKQNDFLWMAEEDSENALAPDVLPQVVVADFRLEEMPTEIQSIIEKYGQLASNAMLAQIEAQLARGDFSGALPHIMTYLAGRDWPKPTVKEFQTVCEFNELLAWVLVFGRKPNHFTLSIHLLDSFENLSVFNTFIEREAQLKLNDEGNIIKGSEQTGIAQSSTLGTMEQVQLADGTITIPTGFVEFVWRFKATPAMHKPILWQDFFTGFVANHANHVIESLYINNP